VQLDQELQKMSGLNIVIIRTPLIYGPGEQSIFSQCLAFVRMAPKNQPFDFVIDPYQSKNNVHVRDLVNAMVESARHYIEKGLKGPLIYNASGPTDFICEAWAESLRNSFKGYLVKLVMPDHQNVPEEDVIEEARKAICFMFLDAWIELNNKNGVSNSPLSPLLETETVSPTTFAMDGSKIEKETKFRYQNRDGVTTQDWYEMMAFYRELGYWPEEEEQ